jgi:hypothetical protein
LGIYLAQASKPAPADTAINVTNAAPAVVTPAAIANYADGDIVMVDKTGFEELDGQYFPISNVTGATFELDCSDTSAQAAAATTGVLKVYKMTGTSANMAKWCLTSYSYDQPQAETIDMSTFCGTESASGQPQPASYSVAGIVDECEEGMAEMMAALKDGKERLMVIKKPSEPPAYVFQTVDVSQYSESYELNAAITFTAGGAIKSGPWSLYCKSCVDLLPINSAVTGNNTATATVTFSGGPADQAYTVTLTATVPAGAVVGLTPVSVVKSATAEQVAAAVAAELDGKQDAGATDTLAASAVGTVVTVTEAGGGNVTVTAVIA